MNKGMPITPKQLMEMKPGPELDALVSEQLEDFIISDHGCGDPFTPAWSTDKKEALDLMETIEERVTQVGLLLMGADAPLFIGNMATVGEESEATMVFTESWQESLSKAFILYRHGFTGEFFDPRFEDKKRNAPKWIVN